MKIGQLYDLDSVKQFNDCWKGFADASSGVVLERNLTHVDPKVFEKKYPELAFMGAGFNLDNTGGFAQRIQSLRLVDEGDFENVSARAGNKGKISLAGEDNFLSVEEFTAEASWTTTELEQAKLQNVNLPGRYVSAFSKRYQRRIDEAGLTGIEGNEGILTYSGYASSASSGAIATLTPQQMYDEYAELITAQHNSVNNTPEYMGNVLFTPVYCINALQSQILNSAGSTKNVLRSLMDNFPSVKFMGTFRADDAGGASSSITSIVSTNEESIKMRIPQPLSMGEVIKKGSFSYETEGMYRIAGCDFLDNTGGRRLTGL